MNYDRLSLEIAQFAKDGADIMIKNKWLEQPPGPLTETTSRTSKTKNTKKPGQYLLVFLI
jgi:hypothetical protein